MVQLITLERLLYIYLNSSLHCTYFVVMNRYRNGVLRKRYWWKVNNTISMHDEKKTYW